MAEMETDKKVLSFHRLRNLQMQNTLILYTKIKNSGGLMYNHRYFFII